MNWMTVLKIGTLLFSIAVGCCITLPKFRAALAAARAAKTEQEKSDAKLKIKDALIGLIIDVEASYKSLNTALKKLGSGETAGSLKKNDVMTKLEQYCINNNYEFDKEYWSAENDKLVDMTKKVN